MDNPLKKKANTSGAPEAERRRIGQVMHDERGNAFVNWRDAPEDHERPVLEVLDAPLSLHREPASYDPYARGRAPRDSARPSGGTTRTDLRKLSEHIKLMRELEARKRNGSGEEED